MVDIPAPQSPLDPRGVMRSLGEDGTIAFSQVGFQELDFGAVFGGKTTSTSSNSIGYGRKTFTLDFDDGKIMPGHTVQITSLTDVTCFMYGVVLSKDDTVPSITISINTISDLVGTFSVWEIQIVEVTREIAVEVGDEDFTLEDHHRVVFYLELLTAPRTLTFSSGDTLMPGTRLLVLDARPGAFTQTNYLSYLTSGRLNRAGAQAEFIWTGTAWTLLELQGYAYGLQAGSVPLTAEEFDDSATAGPWIALHKNSASPAAADQVGLVAFQGEDSASNITTYAAIYGEITDPVNGSEDGDIVVAGMKAGVLTTAATLGPDRNKFNGFFSLGTATSQTISGGVITATTTRTIVDTEAAAAADDLDTVNGGQDGDILILRATNAARVVTVKDGTGNLNLSADFALNTTRDRITLINNAGTAWFELARSDN